jgi:hypothetical protein
LQKIFKKNIIAATFAILFLLSSLIAFAMPVNAQNNLATGTKSCPY